MFQSVLAMTDLKIMVRTNVRPLILSFALVFGACGVFAAENYDPSLDKLIDQIDDIVGGGLAPESFEAKCSFDPNECNLKQLCDIATTGDDGNKSWSAKTEGHVELAKSTAWSVGF